MNKNKTSPGVTKKWKQFKSMELPVLINLIIMSIVELPPRDP